MPGKGSGVPVGAPPTVRTAIKPNLKASPIRTRHGCSYNQYPALGFNARNGIWRTCRSTAHGANRNRTKPQSQPHSHPTRVLLQSISGVGVQCPEWDLVLPVGAPPTVRTAIKPNLRASPHSHPGRVLLQSISGVGVQCPEWDLVLPVGAPPTVRTAIKPNLRASPHSHPGRVLLQNAKESDAYPSHLLRIIYSVIPFLGALLQQFFFILVHIVLSFLIILCMGTGST